MKERIRTVAVVDDKESNRSLVRRSLERLPATILEFRSCGEFVSEYSRGKPLPDVLVLDFFLEKWKTGLTLVSEMAKVRPDFAARTKIVGYSSIATCSMKIAAETGGTWLLKDKKSKYDPNLRAAVRKLLSRTRTFLSAFLK